MRASAVRLLLLLIVPLLTAACGFQLRSTQTLPYESLYVAIPDHSEFGTSLKRAIRASGSTRIVASAEEAEAILAPTGEVRDKSILSLNSAGRVREFELRYRFSYRIHDSKGRDLIEPASITLRRDYSFDEASVLAKEQEETLLWRDMQNDLVQQIMRRLAVSRPKAVAGQ